MCFLRRLVLLQWLVRNETASSLPQADQVSRVIALASTWFRYIGAALDGKAAGATSRLQAALAQAAPVLPLVQSYWADIPGVSGG